MAKKTFEIKPSKAVTKASQQRSMSNGLLSAAIELITNVDDSYERFANKGSPDFKIKQWNGDCRIEYERHNVKDSSYFIIKDKAQGIQYDDLERILSDHGENKESKGAGRGIFNRGLLDCTVIGHLEVITTCDGKCAARAQIKQGQFTGNIEKVKFTSAHQKETGIKKHGTYIKLEIPKGSDPLNAPTDKKLVEYLQKTYQLRNILSTEKSDFKSTLSLKFNDTSMSYTKPDGRLIADEIINIPYRDKDIKARFQLFKSFEELPTENNEDLGHYGITVQTRKALVGKSFLESKFKNDASARHYFGNLSCDYIYHLLSEYRDNAINGELPKDNPTNILHDERKGINTQHPFIKLLFKRPREILEKEITKDKSSVTKSGKSEGMKKTCQKVFEEFDKITKEIDQGQNDEDDGKKPWYVCGAHKVKVGDKETMRVYASSDELQSGLTIKAEIYHGDEKFIKITKNTINLRKTLRDENRFSGEFEIEGLSKKNPVKIKFLYNNVERCETSVNIYQDSNRNFANNIEFEFEEYTVKEKGNRTVKVYAKHALLGDKDIIQAKVINSDHDVIKTAAKFSLSRINGTNYAEGTFIVKGLKLGGMSELKVRIGDDEAATTLEVKKREQKSSPKYDFDIVNSSLGSNIRAQWDINRPNILLITTKHGLVRKYLGSDEKVAGKYPNEDSAEWLLFLADILSEKMAQKLLQKTAENRPNDYSSLNGKITIPEQVDQVQTFYSNEKKTLEIMVHKLLGIGS